MTKRICKYCGKEFEAIGYNSSRRQYCPGPHFAICEYCGKEFLIKDISNGIPKTCSAECANNLRSQKLHASVQQTFGVKNISQVPEFAHTVASINSQNAEVNLKKRKSTMLERYGIEYALQSDVFKQKFKDTCRAKYGVDNPSKYCEIKYKISKRLKSSEVQAQYHLTSKQHYGVEFPAQCKTVQNQIEHTCKHRYGVNHISQLPSVKLKIQDSIAKTRRENPEISIHSKTAIHKTCKSKYGIDWPCQLVQCRSAANKIISKKNKCVAEYLNSLGYETKFEFALESYSYDIFVPELRLLVEIDPTYSHSSIGNHWNNAGKSSDYHLRKSQTANLHGFRCIHIFDWDDISKVFNEFNSKISVNVSKISSVAKTDADKFLNLNCAQNFCNEETIQFGAYSGEDLIELMVFKLLSENEWGLMQISSDNLHKSKDSVKLLFDYFVRVYSPKCIIAYGDIAKDNMQVYIDLGMEFIRNDPPKKIWSKTTHKILATEINSVKYMDVFCGKPSDLTQEEFLLRNNWRPIYDCGNVVYSCENL